MSCAAQRTTLRPAHRITPRAVTLAALAAYPLLGLAAAAVGQEPIPADLNCDGQVTMRLDIEPFVRAVRNPDHWCQAFGRSRQDLLARADFDRDGRLSRNDVPGFTLALAEAWLRGGGDGPAGLGRELSMVTGGGQPLAAGGVQGSGRWALDDPNENPEIVNLCVDSDNDDGLSYPERDELEESVEYKPYEEQVNCDPYSNPQDPNACYHNGKSVPLSSDRNQFVPMVVVIRGDPNSDPNVPSRRYYLNFDDVSHIRIWSARDPNEITSATGWDQHDQSALRLGDMDKNGRVDFLDLNQFIAYLSDPNACSDPNCELLNGDANIDGKVDFGDINSFADLLTTQECTYVARLLVQGCAPTGRVHEETIQLVADTGTDPSHPPGSTYIDRVSVFVSHCCDFDHPSFGVPVGYEELCASFESRCWSNHEAYVGTVGGQPYLWPPPGFPLDLNLLTGFGPGDLPPRKLNPAESSTPLLSKGVVHSRGPRPFAERPMHGGVIDLVTGQPLLQAIDFELPFGGATFRHVRTYSRNIVDHLYTRVEDRAPLDHVIDNDDQGESTFWDWNGRFWSMSENPILLIDAAYDGLADWVGEPNDPNGYGLRICYFIPDAHHAIPFIDQQGNGTYQAPAWFDGALRYSGDASKSAGVWDNDELPSEFYVYTQGRSLKYTFSTVKADVYSYVAGDGRWVHGHAHPRDPQGDPNETGEVGLGIPYYGLVKRIEDSYDNSVEYVYAAQEQTDCSHDFDDVDWNNGCCSRCCQNCNTKGQIKAIYLRSGPADPNGHTDVVWTLLYTHRDFGWFWPADPNDPNQLSPSRPVRLPHKLHSIHAYAGWKPVPAVDLTLSFAERFRLLDSFDAYAEVEHAALPADWTLRAQYTYLENDGRNYWNAGPGTQYNNYANNNYVPRVWDNAHWFRDNNFRGHLLAVNITRRDSTGRRSTTPTVYRARCTGGNSFFTESNGNMALGHVYEAPTVERVLASIGEPDDPNATPARLLYEAETFEVGGNPNVTLADCADLTIVPEAHAGLRQDPNAGLVSPLAEFISAPRETLGVPAETVGKIVDRRGDSPRCFHFYRFNAYPDALTNNTIDEDDHHTVYHWPYRCPQDPGPSPVTRGLTSISSHAAFHVMVVDEVDEEESEYSGPTDGDQLISRRVVEMTAQGFVLSDKTWDPNGVITHQVGFAEQRFYDQHGRVVMIGSKGWGSRVNPDPNSDGLVRVFDYGPYDPNGSPGELLAVGIKKGLAPYTRDPNSHYITAWKDEAKWIAAFERDPDDPKLITKEVHYPYPQADPNAFPPAWTTTTDFVYKDPNAIHKAVIAKTIQRPATLLNQGGAPAASVEKYLYDDKGNLQWSGIGNAESDPNNGGLFFVTYTAYNEFGQPTLNVVDAMENQKDVPDFPEGCARIAPAELPPLELDTHWTYDETYGLTKVVYPNKREMHIVYNPDPNDWRSLYVWQYSDLDPNTLQLRSPVKLTYLRSGQAQWIRELGLTSVAAYPPNGSEDPNAALISESVPSYNMNGQMTGVAKTAGDETLQASLSYYTGDLIAREKAPDGTLTHYTYDEFNRLERTYRGTHDEAPYWGSEPNDPNNYLDDMVLIEKRYYGEGVTDADQLNCVRHYRDKPVNQYFMVDPNDPNVWYGGTPNEDDIGWTSTIAYDWRMRPVHTTENDPNGVALRHSVTWYDNLDRPLIVAEFGPVANLGAYDPTGANMAWWPAESGNVDAVAAALAGVVAPAPLSVRQTVYNDRGLPQEQRDWVKSGSAATYTSTFTCYDHANRPREVTAPNAPVQTYLHDAKGRQVQSASVAAGACVSKTETEYDDNDRPVQTTTTEYDPNAPVRTYTRTLYDDAGRVTQVINYGTAHTGFIFADADLVDPNNVIGALITSYEYDEAGRQNLVHHHGTQTRSVYDGLGRLRLTVENATPAGGTPWRRTAYDYDEAGRLIAIAAVPPGYANITNVDGVNAFFGGPPADAQITTFQYEADILPGSWTMEGWSPAAGWEACIGGDPNVAWTTQSGNNALISRVTYPDPDPNSPGRSDWLEFSYYSDGSVAQRTDARGTEFYYRYDTLGRLTDIWVDDVAYYCQAAPWDPGVRTHHVAMSYTADGQPENVTAYSYASGVDTIAGNAFVYNGRGRLEREAQQHFGVADPNTSPTVTYDWAYAPMGAGNYERLVGMGYPHAGRALWMGYGEPNSVHSALSRVASIVELHTPPTTLASYAYTGLSRRTALALGGPLGAGVVNQTFGTGSMYPGLDQFGRIIDLHYAKTSLGGMTLQRFNHGYAEGGAQRVTGYDAAGNRLFARITQVDPNGLPVENERSWVYGYDALSRLVAADFGELTTNNTAIVIGSGVPLSRELTWGLDHLGNWAGVDPNDPNAVPGLRRTDDPNSTGTPTYDQWIWQAPNLANEINVLKEEVNGDPNLTVQTAFVHDRAGNLVWDGRLFYQYDGYNRLVQVHAATQLVPADFNADGQLVYDPNDPNNP
ncbi:MAG: hypothetical protein AB1716_10555, partial [Planctomycetota bacterium]